MANIPNLTDMLKAGVHFGHQRSRWHPKMKQYIFGLRNGVHILDLDKTQEELAKALEFVKNQASQGKIILFVGTKRQAREATKAAAESCGMPFLVERWIGGLLTNFDEFRRRLKKYNTLREQVKTGEIEKYTKKEQSTFKKQLEKLDKYLIGLINLDKIPDALYLVDTRVEKTALTEAEKVGVPMVAVCDSNVNPLKVQYPIPANDDAVNSIKMMVDLIAEAINEGKEIWEKKKNEVKVAAVKELNPEEKAAPAKVVAAAPKKERRPMKKNDIV